MLAQVGVIYRWLAATQSWTSFRPGAPAILSAFDTFATGGSYWIAVAEEVEWVVGGDGGLSAAALSPPQHRASQAEGRGFEPLLPLQTPTVGHLLTRVSACVRVGRMGESGRADAALLALIALVGAAATAAAARAAFSPAAGLLAAG